MQTERWKTSNQTIKTWFGTPPFGAWLFAARGLPGRGFVVLWLGAAVWLSSVACLDGLSLVGFCVLTTVSFAPFCFPLAAAPGLGSRVRALVSVRWACLSRNVDLFGVGSGRRALRDFSLYHGLTGANFLTPPVSSLLPTGEEARRDYFRFCFYFSLSVRFVFLLSRLFSCLPSSSLFWVFMLCALVVAMSFVLVSLLRPALFLLSHALSGGPWWFFSWCSPSFSRLEVVFTLLVAPFRSLFCLTVPSP